MGKPKNATTKAGNVTAQPKELSEKNVNVATLSITTMETPLKIPVTTIWPLTISSPSTCPSRKISICAASISRIHPPKPTWTWTFQSPVQSRPKWTWRSSTPIMKAPKKSRLWWTKIAPNSSLGSPKMSSFLGTRPTRHFTSTSMILSRLCGSSSASRNTPNWTYCNSSSRSPHAFWRSYLSPRCCGKSSRNSTATVDAKGSTSKWSRWPRGRSAPSSSSWTNCPITMRHLTYQIAQRSIQRCRNTTLKLAALARRSTCIIQAGQIGAALMTAMFPNKGKESLLYRLVWWSIGKKTSLMSEGGEK